MKYYADLTNEEARDWLIRKDKEAADYWRDVQSTELADCVFENIRDFGTDNEVCILKLVSVDDTLATAESRGIAPLLLELSPNACSIRATGQKFAYTDRDDLEQKLIDLIINRQSL